MISVRVHKHLKYAIIFALGLFLGSTAFASADTFTRTPTGSGVYGSITVTGSVTSSSMCQGSWGLAFIQHTPYFFIVGSTYNAKNDNTIPTTTLTFADNYNVQEIATLCDIVDGTTYGSVINTLSYSGGSNLFQTQPFVPPPPPPSQQGLVSFINYDDITPNDMLASVRAGVQDSTENILPMIALVGIPIAFLLLLALINFINQSVDSKKLTTGKKSGREWTARGVLDHDLAEFKKKERSRIKRNL